MIYVICILVGALFYGMAGWMFALRLTGLWHAIETIACSIVGLVLSGYGSDSAINVSFAEVPGYEPSSCILLKLAITLGSAAIFGITSYTLSIITRDAGARGKP